MRNGWAACLLLAVAPLWGAKSLQIHFIDVEGGQSTLIVSPSGESLLVDTGWPGFEGRDAERIKAAAKKAGVKKIDYLLITHFHTDHVGGILQLSDRMEIGNFVSHGANTETGKNAEALQEAFDRAAAKGKKITVKVGDKLPLKGLDIEIVSSNGEVSRKAGAATNPLCAGAARKEEDKSENARSVGLVLTFGKFRFLNLGDLTWNKEIELSCPENRIGKIDLMLSTHHGAESSSPPQLVHAVKPRVVVMNNGARKGGDLSAWKIFKNVPGLEDLWQLHFAVKSGKEGNVDDPYIANLQSPGGQSITVTAESSGAFRVLNMRNKFEKVYAAR